MNRKTIIGLEIHVELSTESKMFCGCKNEFGQAPNTNVCEVCLGHPGALPVVNEKAVEYAVMAGLAFDCNMRTDMKMDRKKYFYPDLTKGYQITQQDEPIATDGFVELVLANGTKKVRIRRIHMEEDTGKAIHNEDGKTLMDFNRCGVPLIEIVSEPDMSNPEEARLFLDNLKERLKFLGVSDVKMEEGSLRCDVNINVVDEETGFATRISEIKNLNSFKSAVKAMIYEEKRHIELLESGEEGVKETRRWDDATQSTIPMRMKEVGNDYRFSVEGDIPFIRLDPAWIETIRKNLPELPHDMQERFVSQYAIAEEDAVILSQNKGLATLFERTTALVGDPKQTANWILSDLLRRVNDAEIEVEDMVLSSSNLAKLIRVTMDGTINNATAKKLLREIFETDEDPENLIKERGLAQVSDTSALEAIVNQVLADNPQSIEDFKNGKDRALGFLMGQCMKQSKGKGNPQMFNKLITDKLNK